MPQPRGRSNLLGTESDDEEEEEAVLSKHEKTEERMRKRIKKLEEMAVGEKAWQMGGEVAAPVR